MIVGLIASLTVATWAYLALGRGDFWRTRERDVNTQAPASWPPVTAIVAAREGLRLALIASLQYLPPRQRAVLVLRDVLAIPAAEVAVMLGTTTVSVKSALQRARARQAAITRNLYTWTNYKNWADQVRDSWSNNENNAPPAGGKVKK